MTRTTTMVVTDSAAPERPVGALAELRLDGVGDHHAVLAADQPRRDVVADGRDHHDQQRRDHAGQRQRQRDAQEAPQRAVAEIGRRLDQRAVDLLQRDEDRQDRERRPGVGQRDAPRRWCCRGRRSTGSSMMPSPIRPELSTPLIAEDHLPRHHPQQIARPERDGDQEQPQRLVPAAVEGDVVGDRIGQDDGEQADQRRDPQRAHEQVAVDRLGQRQRGSFPA